MLLADGSSDRALVPIINWSIKEFDPSVVPEGEMVDFSRFKKPPKALSDRISAAIEFYPCEVLFIHRDAEGKSVHLRSEEIETAITSLGKVFRYVKVIPVRMTESWLLGDDDAIRKASGNRNAGVLSLPGINRMERVDAKQELQELLREASGTTGRRRINFNRDIGKHVQLVAQYTADFSYLSQLPSFQAFQNELKEFLTTYYAPSPQNPQ